MKVEPCIILRLFLNFNDAEAHYSYKLYTYKKEFKKSALRFSEELGMFIKTFVTFDCRVREWVDYLRFFSLYMGVAITTLFCSSSLLQLAQR